MATPAPFSADPFRALADATPDVVIAIDPQSVIHFVNPAVQPLFGYAPEELIGRSLTLLVPERLRARHLADAARHLEAARPGGPWRPAAFAGLHRDGTEIPLEVCWNVVRLGEGDYLTGLLRPRAPGHLRVTAEAHAALPGTEQRYALAARGANDGLWDWDLETNRIAYSSRWKAMLGYQESEIGDRPEEWFGRVHPHDLRGLRAAIDAHLTGGVPHFEHEHRMLHQEGVYRWVVVCGVSLRDPARGPVRIAGSLTDITNRKEAEFRLRDQATRDALTDLPNRALFTELLAQAVGHARRNPGYRFAVLFLDLDRFKIVNDTLGHLVGDQFLIAIAHRIEHCLRPRDTVARLGGDEFAVLLDGVVGTDDATAVAGRIETALARPFEINGHQVFTTVSIGITESSVGYTREEDVLRDADLAMYRAKAAGRSRHQVFDAAMHADAMAQLELETALRRAVHRGELVLEYQPIVALRVRQIAGFEALVRWQHPHRGLVPPSEFIPMAEETGLIVSLGRWVLREACRQMAEWLRARPGAAGLSVSVNVAAKELFQADFLDSLRGILHETGLHAARLRLELTESTLMQDMEWASRVLAQLRALGIGILLDDFGTGYSSLGHLYRLPIDTLKIDRSFVAALDLSRQTSEVFQAIAALARALGIDLIAEGVETEQQFTALLALRCRLGQGFYLAYPTPAETVAAWITGRDSHPVVRLPPTTH
jgi:diguanylate cyclase (GGDEF)-like protein/PAS domain S-box-containing protein